MPVLGMPMVVRAVRAVLDTGLVERVTVVTAETLRPDVARSCAGEPVVVRSPDEMHGVGAHTLQRADSTTGDGFVTGGAGNGVVLLHDASRPLAPAALAAAVVHAVRDGHAMAVPVLALPDTVKRVDERGLVTATPDRAGLRVLQTPIAARARLLREPGTDPLAAVRRFTAAGGTVHTVPGHPAAFAVRSEWDLELAELVAGGKILL
jgi:2-C-methyl-D-erythritol 4-phosphate cytidylyltransferase